MATCSTLAFGATDGSESADLARVETLAKQTRVSEARIIDEIMGRMGRIESTTSDIRTLLEAMPDGGAAPPSTPATQAAPAATPKPAVCASPAVGADATEDDSTRFPLSLAAGGSALIALLIGLRLGRRRSTATPDGAKPLTNTPSRNGPDSVPSNSPISRASAAPATSEPPSALDNTVWRPGKSSGSHATVATPPTQGASAASADPHTFKSSPTQSASPSAIGTTSASSNGDSTGASPRQALVSAPATSSDDAFDPTLELADIMMSMGLASGAAQALEEHIRANPREALIHWLKLLEVYRKDGHRADFENAARELRKNFNIQASDWLALGGQAPSLEDFTRVIAQITALWNDPAQCVAFMTNLLEDNRDGMRNGFPQPVAEEILLLASIQRSKAPELTIAKPVAAPASKPEPDPAAALELS